MESASEKEFKRNYQSHLKHLKLKGMQPKTVDAYSRAVRRIGARFKYRIGDLSEKQLTDYFCELLQSHSWSAVKLDLYGLKFFYTYVLRKPWVAVDLVKPPKSRRLPDVLTVEEVQSLIHHTRTVSYRVFYFTLYSLGLRLGEGLRLQVGDIDAAHRRVHIRNAKGNKDRFVPLPTATLLLLRRFWLLHRNPVLLFPSRQGGTRAAAQARGPLDRGGVQNAMRQIVQECGIKKRSARTVCATASPLT